MNYFKNINNEIFAYDDEQVTQGYGKDLTEIEEVYFNGTLLPNHKNLQYDKEGNIVYPADIQAILDAEQAELDATEYQRLRQAEYPPIEDYIDGIVKGDEAQVQEYIDKCLAVKAKYPKYEEIV